MATKQTPSISIHLSSLDALHVFTSELTPFLEPGHIVLLQGDLGAGKTTFVLSILACIDPTIRGGSPTYTLIHHYPTAPPIYHVDLYRVSESRSIDHLDIGAYFAKSNTILMIEWAQYLQGFMPAHYLSISFQFKDDNARQLNVSSKGDRYKSVMTFLAQYGK